MTLTNAARSVEHLAEPVATGVAASRRAATHEVFPPRVAIARGRNALVLATLALGAFAVLFALVRRDRSASIDLAVTRAWQRRQSPWFRRLMTLVSWPGFSPQSRLLPPSLALAWLVIGFRLEAAFQLMAWGTSGISFAVKTIMQRPRPSHPAVQVTAAHLGDTSFPSGHVLNYMGVYGFLSYLIATLVRPAIPRRIALALLLSLLALVGPSRVYLGHHWATDVTASYLLGTSYLLTVAAFYRRAKMWMLRR